MNPAALDGYFDMPPESAKTPEGVPIRWNYVVNGGGAKLPICEYPDNPHAGRGLARSLSTIEQPDRTVLMAEGTTWWLNAEAKSDSNRMYRWKDGSTNVLFVDGSTRTLNCKTDLVAAQFLED